MILNIHKGARRMVVSTYDLQILGRYDTVFDQMVNDSTRSFRSYFLAQLKHFRMNLVQHDGKK